MGFHFPIKQEKWLSVAWLTLRLLRYLCFQVLGSLFAPAAVDLISALSFIFKSQYDENLKELFLSVDLQHLNVNQIQVVVRRCSSPNVTEETTYFIPRNPVVDAGTNTDPPVVCCPLLRRFCPCPPRGLLASLVTKGKCRIVFSPGPGLRCAGLISSLMFVSSSVLLAAVLFGAVWSITEDECLPGGNLFGVTTLFICALVGGKLVALIRLPRLPPFPPLLGKTLLFADFISHHSYSIIVQNIKMHVRSTIPSLTTNFQFINGLCWKYMKVVFFFFLQFIDKWQE